MRRPPRRCRVLANRTLRRLDLATISPQVVPNYQMRFIRCLLLMLLAINLPGFSGAFAGAPACSMQRGQGDGGAHHAVMADGSMAAMSGHGAHCCPDGASKAATDHGCADGMQCQCSGLYQTAQPLIALVLPASPGIDQTSSFHVITASALPHWRPPTIS